MKTRVFIPATAALLPLTAPEAGAALLADQSANEPSALAWMVAAPAPPARNDSREFPLSSDAVARRTAPLIPSLAGPVTGGSWLPVEGLPARQDFGASPGVPSAPARAWTAPPAGLTSIMTRAVERQEFEDVGVLFPNDRLLGASGLARFIPCPGAAGAMSGASCVALRRRRARG